MYCIISPSSSSPDAIYFWIWCMNMWSERFLGSRVLLWWSLWYLRFTWTKVSFLSRTLEKHHHSTHIIPPKIKSLPLTLCFYHILLPPLFKTCSPPLLMQEFFNAFSSWRGWWWWLSCSSIQKSTMWSGSLSFSFSLKRTTFWVRLTQSLSLSPVVVPSVCESGGGGGSLSLYPSL